MPSDTPPDPFADALAFGQRMEVLRTRRGMSRPVLAGLLGMSPSWVKQVERGQIQMPKLPVVLRIAELLRVRDLADLTGNQTSSVELFIGPGHPRLPAVRDAVNALTLDDSDRPAPGPRTSPPASRPPGRPGTRLLITVTSWALCFPA